MRKSVRELDQRVLLWRWVEGCRMKDEKEGGGKKGREKDQLQKEVSLYHSCKYSSPVDSRKLSEAFCTLCQAIVASCSRKDCTSYEASPRYAAEVLEWKILSERRKRRRSGPRRAPHMVLPRLGSLPACDTSLIGGARWAS